MIETARRMATHLAHRGPDDRGLYAAPSGQAVLAHRRLSIIDPGPGGHQPMAGAKGKLRIVFNGEIYNYEALRDDLRRNGYRFKTASDTEVLLAAWSERGPGCLTDLRGMFAFAVWDDRDGSLHLVTDQFGIKPLYYCRQGDTVIFASELRALLASGHVSSELDPVALVRYLEWGIVPAPHTSAKACTALEPATHIRLSRAGTEQRKYWTVRPNELLEQMTDKRTKGLRWEPLLEEVRNGLEESVEAHLVSDVPVGIFLSGGVDSSALVAASRGIAKENLWTVNVAFDEAAYDESRFARLVAEEYGTRHVETHVSRQDFLELLPDFFASLDQPTVDGLNTYFVARAAHAAGLKVMLSGAGADELFLGYEHHLTFDRVVPMLGALDHMPGFVRKPLLDLVTAILRRRSHGWDRAAYLSQGCDVAALYRLARGLFPPRDICRLLDIDEHEYRQIASVPEPVQTENLRLQFAELDHRLYLRRQLLRDADVMGMAHSVEIRVPFVDREMFDRFFPLVTLPEYWQRGPKAVLREALRGRLPDSLLDRRKAGFELPFRRWLASDEGPVAELLRSHPVLDRQQTRRIWADFRAGRCHWSRPWSLAALGAWFLERDAQTLAA